MEFKSMKFRAYSPEHSVLIQEKLAKLGYISASGAPLPLRTSDPFIYTESDGRVSWDGSSFEKEFIDYPNELLTLDDLYKLTAEPVIKVGVWDVEFNADSITVGCTTIPNETVKAIHDKIFKP